jgi:hypothetical protein
MPPIHPRPSEGVATPADEITTSSADVVVVEEVAEKPLPRRKTRRGK